VHLAGALVGIISEGIVFECKMSISVFACKGGSWLITFNQISWENCQTIQKSHF